MKQKNKIKKNTSVNQIALYNAFFALILVIILYFVLPTILNYPSNTINNDFQLQVVGIKYNSQFAILASLIVTFIFFFVRFIYNKLYKGAMSSTSESIAKTRKKCFNAPFLMIIFEVLLPTLLSSILLAVFKTNLSLLIRLGIVIFSFAAIFAPISYMIGRSFFRNLLVKTSSKCKKDLETFKLRMPSKLLILTLPLFICSFVILLLISFTTTTLEKGSLLYDFYKQELITSLDKDLLTYEDLKSVFDDFIFKSDADFGLIMDSNTGTILYKSKNKNIEDPAFLSAYTLNFYTDENGQCFEYYGQDVQVAMHKIQTKNGTYFVGVQFSTFSLNTFLPFILCIFVLVIFIIIFITYIGKTISADITNITNGLNSILNLADISTAKNLPITSNDEFGDLTISYNKIQDLTVSHINQIEYNQDKLMEQERLASLGQLIGRNCTQFKNSYNVNFWC